MAHTTALGFAREVAKLIRSRGFSVYFAGGCVRDLLLGREPKDFDITTNARPEQVQAMFPGANLVGAHFGVVMVPGEDTHVEVATFRSDHAYADGRHPGRVIFETDPRQDVLRRDFTINGLLMDPSSSEVIDYAGGRADLERGVIRAIGDPEQRFAEDHLRMLRAVRFAARLGFSIEESTMQAMQRLHEKILIVSAERIRDELIRILIEGGARRGLELLDESLQLGDLLPEVAAMKGVEQPPEYHPEGDVWTHTLIMVDGLREPSPALAFGVLLHDAGKPGTFRRAPDRIRFDGHVELGLQLARAILERLRFSNADIEQVLALVANHMKFGAAERMRASTLKRFLRMERFEEHLELHRLDCESSHRNLDTYSFVAGKLREIPAEQLRPERLVTGADLIAAGYRPGPQFSEILRFLEDAQLEGKATSKEEALRLAAENWPR